MGRKSKCTPYFLKHNSALLFNPVKIAKISTFFFTDIVPNIAKNIPKGKKSPMTYLNDNILKYFYFYPTTPNEIVKSGHNSLPTPILENCTDVLSFIFSQSFFATGKFLNLCKIARVIPLSLLFP